MISSSCSHWLSSDCSGRTTMGAKTIENWSHTMNVAFHHSWSFYSLCRRILYKLLWGARVSHSICCIASSTSLRAKHEVGFCCRPDCCLELSIFTRNYCCIQYKFQCLQKYNIDSCRPRISAMFALEKISPFPHLSAHIIATLLTCLQSYNSRKCAGRDLTVGLLKKHLIVSQWHSIHIADNNMALYRKFFLYPGENTFQCYLVK